MFVEDGFSIDRYDIFELLTSRGRHKASMNRDGVSDDVRIGKCFPSFESLILVEVIWWGVLN